MAVSSVGDNARADHGGCLEPHDEPTELYQTSGRGVALRAGVRGPGSRAGLSPTADDPFIGALGILQTFAFLCTGLRAVVACGDAPQASLP